MRGDPIHGCTCFAGATLGAEERRPFDVRDEVGEGRLLDADPGENGRGEVGRGPGEGPAAGAGRGEEEAGSALPVRMVAVQLLRQRGVPRVERGAVIVGEEASGDADGPARVGDLDDGLRKGRGRS